MSCFGVIGNSFCGHGSRLEKLVDLRKDISSLNIRIFSLKSLKIATKNFSEVLGRGGFGCVYHGILEDGTEIAVKNHSSSRRRDEFSSLIEIMSRVRHRNITQLIGCCIEQNSLITVHEFAENSSLDRFLFASEDGRSALNWGMRAAIAIGVARGLAYLHEEINPRIVHRNIKPQNILLDRNLAPKIADFELAQSFDDDASHCSDTIKGTLGYLDPEYYSSGQFTEKLDVYSFGVLLLEIISGDRNSLRKDDRQPCLVDRVWGLQESNMLLDIVDPALVDFPEDLLINFINTALFCLQAPANLRPSMSEVVLMLSGGYNFSGKEPRKPSWISSFSQRRDSLSHGEISISEVLEDREENIHGKVVETAPSFGEIFSVHKSGKEHEFTEAEGTSLKSDQLENVGEAGNVNREENIHGKVFETAPSVEELFSMPKFGMWHKFTEAEGMSLKNDQLENVGEEGDVVPLNLIELDSIFFEMESLTDHSNTEQQMPILTDQTSYFDKSMQSNIPTAAALRGPSDETMHPETMASSSVNMYISSTNEADGFSSLTKNKYQNQVLSPPKVNTKQSIECTVQDILAALKDVQVRKVGIYGKGGIGKTSVLKALTSHFKMKRLFDFVIWVTVSRYSCRKKIQDQILKHLTLQVDSNSEDEIAGAIFNHLKGRKFLLLLDDVWEMINLEEIGIPNIYQENGWRLVLTSRSLDMCLRMADRQFELKVLSRTEAWELFHCQAGEIIDHLEIQPYARAIVEKCGGLPLLIVVTGKALRMERNVEKWKLALEKLLVPGTVSIGEATNLQLKFSYDQLKASDMKSCFLYCALFPEDKLINVSELVECLVDERLLAGTMTTAFERGYVIVRHLVDASLLETTDDINIVKLHDVVRDMALSILSSEMEVSQLLVRSDFMLTQLPKLKRGMSPSRQKSALASESVEGFGASEILSPDVNEYMTLAHVGLKMPPLEEEWEHARMIFLTDNDLSSLPVRPNCPNLSVLFLQRNCKLRVIPASFFDLMPSLQVLNLSKTRIRCLPQSLSKLKCLQVLILRNSERLLVLPPEIGNLKFLEVLDLRGTKLIHLPDTVVGLVSLKHLQVSFYGSVIQSENARLPKNLISKGVISSLKLTELAIFVYPGDQRWASNAFDVTMDVSSLKLSTLAFHFPDLKHLEYFIHENPSWKLGSLSVYSFIVGPDVKRIVSQVSYDVELMCSQHDRCLRYVNGENIPDAIVQVLKQSTSLYLDHHLSICYLSDFGSTNTQALKFCIVRDCPRLKAIINDTELETSVFPYLEHLGIYHLWNLNRIWVGQLPTGSFSQLRYLSLHACPQLTFLFSCSMIDVFFNLEELVVEDCPSLKDVVTEHEAFTGDNYSVSVKESVDNPQMVTPGVIVLHKLQILKLHYLPELTGIWKGPWPSLKSISFYNCPNLKNLHMDSFVEASIEEIMAEVAWWDALEWEDISLAGRLRSIVTEISDGGL
ncbi:hypothetical protein Nepgr_020063 [Nepenthes gracilis]|uniref:non-specific serine/threonine protein kinase n=1 Tax=Nepenthes gracilis TaxID=150966 RepID=A0AAD3XUP0_NEPGR|nr:hypothetical protein Nepgr_020063 [Nepenthes gracilis]